MNRKNKIVLVIGAHRSGTSLCTAAVEALGASTGIEQLYINDENEKGFFEHPELVEFNERLLEALEGSWDNPFFDATEASKKASILSWKIKAVDLIKNNFSASHFTVIKDPRFCQLLAFWLEAFEAAGFQRNEIFLIHIFRDPVEVAKSQVSRVKARPEYYELGRTMNEAALLWYSLTLQALRYADTAEIQSHFVFYEDLLENTKEKVSELAAFLEITSKDVWDDIQDFSNNFVEKKLRHEITDTDSSEILKRVLPEAIDLYALLHEIKAEQKISATSRSQIEFLYEQLDHHLKPFSVPAISRLSNLSRIRGIALLQQGNVSEQLEARVSAIEADREEVRVAFQNEMEKLRQEYEKLNSWKSEVVASSEDTLPEPDILKQQEQVAENCLLPVHGKEDHDELLSKLEELRKDNAHMSWLVKEVTGSNSWKITAPLRTLKTHMVKLSPQNYWLKFRYLSQRTYSSLYRKHPKLSRAIRKTLRPVFYFFDKQLNLRKQYLGGSSRAGSNDEHFDEIFQKPELIDEAMSFKVSVIVPNYNHSAFLHERLNTIYQQTYQNFEVILLDDCSTDNSVDVLREFEQRYPDKTKLVVNEKNSGGVFHQWKKGLELASGDLVWIAESDDYSSKNFLETLVPFFKNEAVSVAYSQTIFVRGAEAEPVWSIQEYLTDIDAERWRHPFVETGHEIVKAAFALKNIIPNVSSAVFRNLDDFEVFHDPQWMKMRTCGDWILYLHLIRGGMLAYSPQATNYYRLHDSNTSVSSYKNDVFYLEHEQVAKTVQRYFTVSDDIFAKQKANLEEHWLRTRNGFSQDQFDACYSLDRIFEEPSEKAVNLLMAGYAFSAGGGETFPIMLANMLKGVGYNVTFLDCNQEPRVKEIRQSLRSDIPVVSDIANLPEIVEKFGIDIIHSHHGWVDNTILDLLPEKSACKTVVTLHGFYETVDDEDLEVLLPRLVRRSAKLIYTAEKNLEALKRFNLVQTEKIERIDNALNIEPFNAIDRASHGIPETAFLLTLVARAIPDKGWREAIEAVSKARDLSGENIHLILIGEGPVYDELCAKTLPDYIHLLGFRKNLRDFFAASDLGFLPSRFEGESFPLVIIDCLHAGCPVLASSIGEIPHMLTTEEGMAGVLFDLKDWSIDVDALAGKISALVNNKTQLEAIRGCVSLAAAAFDPEVLAQRYDEAYRQCLS